jgi:hypothetical protein
MTHLLLRTLEGLSGVRRANITGALALVCQASKALRPKLLRANQTKITIYCHRKHPLTFGWHFGMLTATCSMQAGVF